MISWLQYSKTANFYKRARRLPKIAIADAFKTIRLSTTDPSRNLFLHLQEELNGALWSALAFFHEREPSFLELPANHTRERICGFVLLVEYKQHIAIFKSGLDLPASFRSKYLRPVGSDRIEAATARADATFEQIRLRNMGASKYAMRTKTLEADDLRSVLSPSGSNRYVPSAFRTRESKAHYSATPSTGRISERSERLGYEDLVDWAKEVIDRLTNTTAALSTFIRNFARPMQLSAISSELQATSVAIDIAALTESLFEEPAPIRLLRRHEGQWPPLTRTEVALVLEALAQTFEVRRVRKELRLVDPRNGETIGEIRVGRTRVSLRQFDLPEADGVFVQRLDGSGAGATDSEPLKRYIDQGNLFTVLFSKMDVVYMEGSLYQDPSLVDGGELLLGYLHGNDHLELTTSEKGGFSPGHLQFDADSVFGAVVQNLSPAGELLACDDLGDEWADFIGVNSSAQPKTVTFYHAKHGKLSLSASAFHVSVSQAIKNLQHLRLAPGTLDVKKDKWEEHYRNEGEQTQIPRLAKGTFAQIRGRVRETAHSPDTIRRVHIVTDSLSKQEVADTLAAAKLGTRPPAHFVQLYALLMGFFSACTEVGAFPAVVCRP